MRPTSLESAGPRAYRRDRRAPSRTFAALAALAALASLTLWACSSATDEPASAARFPCGAATCALATEYCLEPRGPGFCPTGDAGGCLAGCPGCPALPPPSCAPIPEACAASPTCACLGAAACGTTPAMCDTSTGGPRVDCLSS